MVGGVHLRYTLGVMRAVYPGVMRAVYPGWERCTLWGGIPWVVGRCTLVGVYQAIYHPTMLSRVHPACYTVLLGVYTASVLRWVCR